VQALSVTSTDFTNMAPLVTICALGTLLPLPLLRLVPVLDNGDEELDGDAVKHGKDAD
jgi:hypothetical protein